MTLRSPALAAALATLCLVACREHASPEQLAASLTAKGLHVDTKDNIPMQPEWVGAEIALELVLDYEDTYRAVRFSSSDLARGWCNGGERTVHVSAWCLEPEDARYKQETWQKVAALRTQ